MADLRNQAASPTAMRRAEKMRRACELRVGGRSYRRIAGLMGISKSDAQRLVVEGFEILKQDRDKAIEEAREVELLRLDSIVEALWRNRGDHQVANALRGISQRRADLLGLDAPKKIDAGLSVPREPDGPYDFKKLTVAQLRELEGLALAALTAPKTEPAGDGEGS